MAGCGLQTNQLDSECCRASRQAAEQAYSIPTYRGDLMVVEVLERIGCGQECFAASQLLPRTGMKG